MKTRGFTLIELLIVVAIIAILAAIAVPNFLEAQTRAKVARVKADHRALATALESYYVDHAEYMANQQFRPLASLSTPIAYMGNALLPDPFRPNEPGTFYFYLNSMSSDSLAFEMIQNALVDGGDTALSGALLAVAQGATGQTLAIDQSDADQLFSLNWVMASAGPDGIFRLRQIREETGGVLEGPTSTIVWLEEIAAFGPNLYDPTNGTISDGEIMRTGKGEFTPRILGL